MKNKIIPALLSILMISALFCTSTFAFEGFSDEPRVVDGANLLSDSEEEMLESKISDIMEKYNFDVVIHTAETANGKSPMSYSDDYYDYNGYGYGSNRDGLIFVIIMDTRDYWTSTCGYGITAFTDYGIDYIGSRVAPYLSDGEYYKGFCKYIEYVDDFLNEAENDKPIDTNNNKYVKNDRKNYFIIIVSAFAISLVISLVIMLCIKSGMKGIKQNPYASSYVNQGSFKLTNSRDIYLYSHVTKVRRETSSSSSSGGGSSIHTSSSGSSHGGGGGKF